MKENKEKKEAIYYAGMAVMLFLQFIGPYFFKPWAEGITPEGAKITAVFLGTILGILITNDAIPVSFFAMAAMVFHGIFNAAGVVAAAFGSPLVWQITVLYAFCYFIIRDKTGETLARWILTRKIAQKSPLIMVMALMFTLGLAGALMGAFGALFVGLTLLDSICNEAEVDRFSNTARIVYLGCFITICTGAGMLGPMEGLNVAAASFFESSVGINYIDWKFEVVAVLLIVAECVLLPLVMKAVIRADFSVFNKVDLNKTIEANSTKLSRLQAIPLIGFVIVAICSLTVGFWPAAGVLANLKAFNAGIMITLALGILSIIKIDGKRQYDLMEAFSKGVFWKIVISVAILMALGGLMVNNDYGIKQWLTATVGSIINNQNPVIFVAILVIITIVMTNVFSNSTTLLVVAALAAALCQPLVDAGYNMGPIVVVLFQASMSAFLTHAASGQALIFLGHDNSSMQFNWSKGLILYAFYALILIAVTSFFVIVL